jgi:hypothetical protein
MSINICENKNYLPDGKAKNLNYFLDKKQISDIHLLNIFFIYK